MGILRRKDLCKPPDLKALFRDVRNRLAGMAAGMTRDEVLAQESIQLLLCKILDEERTEPDAAVSFRAEAGEPAELVRRRMAGLFDRVKAASGGQVFLPTDKLKLGDESPRHVVGALQSWCLRDADRDAIGEAFEIFLGSALRGSEGQFFTHRNVVQMMVELVDPKPGETILDPACGSGGFLIGALGHVQGRLREEAGRKGWTESERKAREAAVLAPCFLGINKDTFLVRGSGVVESFAPKDGSRGSKGRQSAGRTNV